MRAQGERIPKAEDELALAKEKKRLRYKQDKEDEIAYDLSCYEREHQDA